eukprot:TRINITY_DN2369_c0_g2_i6.p1 TRINITY_DN2369_c0_g2~~TRINITY_DN2369_c0_g2_i6.p1  ORF type:complete len:349 (+),score=123.83 TRINITY_DN2369_c0_g2_i6:120-1166(+)
MIYYVLGTALIDGSEGVTWDKVCKTGLGLEQTLTNRAFKLSVEKEAFRNATVDTLIGLTDVIQKLDLNLEAIIKKVEKQHKELDPVWNVKISTNEGDMDVLKYMQDFSWEDSKFPRSKTLPELVRLLQEKINHLDNDIKKQITDYTDTRSALAALNKKQEGGLVTRDLTELFINKGLAEDSFPSSRLMVTLVAVVGKNQVKQWVSGYEKLVAFVVPRSSQFLDITDKDGNQLWTVTLFRSSAEEFINKARSQLKVYVREVEYNLEAYEEEKRKQGELTEKIQVIESDLKKNCEIVYSALFESMMHLKVLRGHIESVLRWGVPPKYLSLIHICRCRRYAVCRSRWSPYH